MKLTRYVLALLCMLPLMGAKCDKKKEFSAFEKNILETTVAKAQAAADSWNKLAPKVISVDPAQQAIFTKAINGMSKVNDQAAGLADLAKTVQTDGIHAGTYARLKELAFMARERSKDFDGLCRYMAPKNGEDLSAEFDTCSKNFSELATVLETLSTALQASDKKPDSTAPPKE